MPQLSSDGEEVLVQCIFRREPPAYRFSLVGLEAGREDRQDDDNSITESPEVLGRRVKPLRTHSRMSDSKITNLALDHGSPGHVPTAV